MSRKHSSCLATRSQQNNKTLHSHTLDLTTRLRSNMQRSNLSHHHLIRRACNSFNRCVIARSSPQLVQLHLNRQAQRKKQRHKKKLLNYLASQEEVVITYSASVMVLAAYSDANSHNKSKAWSRTGGHFLLSINSNIPPNNEAILNIAHIIKNVILSSP